MAIWSEKEIKFVIDESKKGKTRKEIAEDFNEKFGTRRTANSIKHCIETYSDYDLVEEAHIDSIKKLHTARKSRSKVAKENKAILDYVEASECFIESFKDALKANPPIVYEPATSMPKKPSKRAIVAHMSDMHIQAQIDEEEMGGINKYGNLEESRRLAYFVREIANYKLPHRKETELVLSINGDILQGIIHDLESTPAITTQVSATLHLLSQAISYLGTKFGKVRVVCTGGNHERMMHKGNKGRQMREKWDSFATIVYIGLQHSLKGHKNIEIEIPTTPYAYVDILGHKYFFTHSDTVLSIGYPGKSINVESAKNKINDLKEGIGHIDVVCVGHVHVDTKQILPNGITLLTNGSMSGLDSFALGIGITANNPTQQIWEVTPEHAVGDLRSVQLKGADKMEELDELIEPFSGKF